MGLGEQDHTIFVADAEGWFALFQICIEIGVAGRGMNTTL